MLLASIMEVCLKYHTDYLTWTGFWLYRPINNQEVEEKEFEAEATTIVFHYHSSRKMEGAVRVQILSQAGISEVPSQYIQPPENRLTPISNILTSLSCSNVPAIDLSHEKESVIADIREACREWGAFHVINHGGYGSRMLVSSQNDTVLDWRDYFDHHTLPLSRRNPSFWPHFPPEYRTLVADYSDEMIVLARRLLRLISESLGLRASCIEDAVGEFYQNITASYYPPCPQPELTLGLQSHSDMGSITLLIQDDVGGLQVLKDGEWLTVQPLPDAILVLLADQTEIITNGKYRSSVHRAVTNASKARLSVACFHDPAKEVRVSPASDLVSQSSPPHYSSIVYGDYVSSWYSKGPEGKRNLDALLLDT
ncbi:probable 2-oxoglutarate-dependent dioxygenase ANS isoform X1 [Durio zibethinus]|uniref:Probable 2-oxoglutarate-dependent dioxygenase ANS isoform X1 n=1 Tax=Durio zibethinus TaxID=66656 RepID=A0A6P5ZL69_DURZI|nr:probable 2-oxoglutarate-dependent dioxygenase ANS isoform X1 [Durio zibethinus]